MKPCCSARLYRSTQVNSEHTVAPYFPQSTLHPFSDSHLVDPAAAREAVLQRQLVQPECGVGDVVGDVEVVCNHGHLGVATR